MEHLRFNYSQLYDYLTSGKYINGIKFVRESFDLDLKEAKSVIDILKSREGLRNNRFGEYSFGDLVADFDLAIKNFYSKDISISDMEDIKKSVEKLPVTDKQSEKIMYLVETAYSIGFDEGERIGFEQALMEEHEDREAEENIDPNPERMWEGTDG